MQFRYTVQKLREAVNDLATGEGSVKERAGRAYIPILALRVEHWPASLAADRRKFEELMAARSDMTDLAARDAARLVVSLFEGAIAENNSASSS